MERTTRGFQGTAEIDKINPNFAEFAKAQEAARSEQTEHEFAKRLAELDSRLVEADLVARSPTRHVCDSKEAGWANVADIRQGIQRLRQLAGGRCGSGAHSCSRMTCNNGGEIHFCNDNGHHIDDRCDWQAYLAELVISKCERRRSATCWAPNPVCPRCCQPADFHEVNGKQYDVRNWNIFVANGPRNWYC